MKKQIILLIAVFIFSPKIFALTYGGCQYSDISRLKSLVTNINISYDYRIENNTVYFDITLNNITPEMYFYDVVNRKNYYYNDTDNGEITIKNYNSNTKNGTYKFFSAKKECNGVSLGLKHYKLPSYNIYYNSDLCEGIQYYSLCQKWTYINYSYDEFKKMIEEYKNKTQKEIIENEKIEYKKGFMSKLIDFYVNYYYYLLMAIIFVFGIIIIIKKRRDKIKL